MKERLRLLNEEVLEKYGAFEIVRRWWRGKYTDGVIIKGLTGWETVTEETIVRPERRFMSIEREKSVSELEELNFGLNRLKQEGKDVGHLRRETEEERWKKEMTEANARIDQFYERERKAEENANRSL